MNGGIPVVSLGVLEVRSLGVLLVSGLSQDFLGVPRGTIQVSHWCLECPICCLGCSGFFPIMPGAPIMSQCVTRVSSGVSGASELSYSVSRVPFWCPGIWVPHVFFPWDPK